MLRLGRKIDYPTSVDLGEAVGLEGIDEFTEPADAGFAWRNTTARMEPASKASPSNKRSELQR